MLQSMTGYGKASVDFEDKTITIEIRSLNSKSLDASLRMPGLYREKEIELRTELAKLFERGKVDVSVSVDYRSEQPSTQINIPLAEAYYKQLKELASKVHEPNANILELVMRMPDVTKSATSMLTEKEYKQFLEPFKKAAQGMISFRKTEGQALLNEFIKRTDLLLGYLEKIEITDPLRIEKIKARIHKNIAEFVTAENIDKNRFEQELIYYLEKIDVTEEKTRLRTHIKHFMDTAKEPASGRKLNFIAQEMGREVNTIGSKANDADIQQIVVLMKDEVEKIKEQTLNVL
ncbi:MAG TPA: YicC/YloC family endoribonuclease [Bacteroidia bacterium]|nr:YicC/YloC family endoribonuclease [Bacteroidia bacterium]